MLKLYVLHTFSIDLNNETIVIGVSFSISSNCSLESSSSGRLVIKFAFKKKNNKKFNFRILQLTYKLKACVH